MERTYTIREMVDALRRRKWLALGVAAIVLVVSAIVIANIPPEYRAESVMQIEPHSLPADYLPVPTSLVSFEERMRTLKHGVLSRPVLQRVLKETNFYDHWQRDPDAAIDRLRRDTEVRLEGEVAGGPPSLLFVVAVHGSDPQKVAKAADLIPRAYAEVTRQVLRDQAQNLHSVLVRQLDDLGQQLSAEEKRLIAFTNEHALEMPAGNDANQRAAGTLVAQIDLRLANIADAQRRRTLLYASVPEATTDAGLAGISADDVMRKLETARAQYGNDNPDVKRLERQYKEVAGRSADELKRYRRERLGAQAARIDQEIRDDQAVVKRLQDQLAVIQKRMDAAPRWAEQYRVQSRQADILRGKYASTLSRASDAQAAIALLAADGPTLFRVVQDAVVPTRPSGQTPLNRFLVALAIAIGAALLATAAAEYFDSSLRGPQDATAFGVPVLASIPRIGPRRSTGQR